MSNPTKKNDMWSELTSDQYIRLCDCRSFKTDIFDIARCFMLNKNMEPEDALASALDHLDSNSQWFDLTRDEYDDLVNRLKDAYH